MKQSKRKAVLPAPPATGISFAVRPPSSTWERIALPDSPENSVWAWFKPGGAPQAIFRVPDETYRDHPDWAAQWTLRRLLAAAAIEPAVVSAWLLNGVSFPALNGTSPYLDAPLPARAAGTSPDIVVYVQGAGFNTPGPVVVGPLVVLAGPPLGAVGLPPQNGVMLPAMAPLAAGPLPMMVLPPGLPASVPFAPTVFPGAPVGTVAPNGAPAELNNVPLDAAMADIYERIEADWHSANEIEKDLARVRKQLVDILGRLKTLNRDLTPPERVHSNNQDKKDWQDARRGLRDATNRAWKYLKAHDIGDTSNAGKRVWFEEIYRKFIASRQRFDGLMAAARAFEMHRKTITQLHCDMSNAYSFASLDGERKALQVLARIQTKVREASNKKTFLGVILDS